MTKLDVFTMIIMSILVIGSCTYALIDRISKSEIKALKQENNELKIDLEISSICNDLLKIE